MSQGKQRYYLPVLERGDVENTLMSSESASGLLRNVLPLTSWSSEFDLRAATRKICTKNALSASIELCESEDPSYESIMECSAQRGIARAQNKSVTSLSPFRTFRRYREKGDGAKVSTASLQVPDLMQRSRSEELLRGEPVYESVADAKGKGVRKRSSAPMSSLESVKGYFARLTGHPAPVAAQSSESLVDDATQTDSDEGVSSDVSPNVVKLRSRLRQRPLPRRPLPSPDASMDSSSRRNSKDSNSSDYESLCDLKLDSLRRGLDQPSSRPRSCIEPEVKFSCFGSHSNAAARAALPGLGIGERCHHMSMLELNSVKWKELSTSSFEAQCRVNGSPLNTPPSSTASSQADGLNERGSSFHLTRSSVLTKWPGIAKRKNERSLTPPLSVDLGLESVDAFNRRSLLKGTWAPKENAAALPRAICESECESSMDSLKFVRSSESFFKKRNSYPALGATGNKELLLIRKKRRIGSADCVPNSPAESSLPQVGSRPSVIRRWISGLTRPSETKRDASSPSISESGVPRDAPCDTPCDCQYPTKGRICATSGGASSDESMSQQFWRDGDRLFLVFALYVMLFAVRLSVGLFASLLTRDVTEERADSKTRPLERRSGAHEYEDLNNLSRAKTLRFPLKDCTKRLLSQPKKNLHSKSSTIDFQSTADSLIHIAGGEAFADVFEAGDAECADDPSYARIAMTPRPMPTPEPLYSSIHSSSCLCDSNICEPDRHCEEIAKQHQLGGGDSSCGSINSYRTSGSQPGDRSYEDPDVLLAETKPQMTPLNSQLSYLLSSADWGSLQICYDEDQYLVPFDLSTSNISALASGEVD